jgi:hypothetical protein
VKNDPPDELDVEMPPIERAAAGLSDYGTGFRKQVLERLAFASRVSTIIQGISGLGNGRLYGMESG